MSQPTDAEKRSSQTQLIIDAQGVSTQVPTLEEWAFRLEHELDKARDTISKWEEELSKVMPADFKDWWQNNKAEWPLVARLVIENLRNNNSFDYAVILGHPVSAWRSMDSAPKDRLIEVYAPSAHGLPPLVSLCKHHEDAGFCICELRNPTHWRHHLPPPPVEQKPE